MPNEKKAYEKQIENNMKIWWNLSQLKRFEFEIKLDTRGSQYIKNYADQELFAQTLGS